MRLTPTILFWLLTAALAAGAETPVTTQSIAIPHHLMWYPTTAPEDIMMVYLRIDRMTPHGTAPGFHYETTGDVKFFNEENAFRFLLSRYLKRDGLSTNLHDFKYFFRRASGTYPRRAADKIKKPMPDKRRLPEADKPDPTAPPDPNAMSVDDLMALINQLMQTEQK